MTKHIIGSAPNTKPTKKRKKFMLNARIITRFNAQARKHHTSKNALLKAIIVEALEQYKHQSLFLYSHISAFEQEESLWNT